MPLSGRVARPCGTRRSALTLALAATALLIPASAMAAPVGSKSVQSKRDSNRAGRAEAFKTVASALALVKSLHVYLDASSTASRVELGCRTAGTRARSLPR